MDFEINGVSYRSDRMDAFRQFHVARKLAPVVSEVVPFLARGVSLDSGLSDLEPVMKAIAAMPEDDCNYVLQSCLSVVRRQQGQGYAPVWNDGAQRMMFADVDLPVMLQIAARVLQDNLSSFTGALPSASTVAVR